MNKLSTKLALSAAFALFTSTMLAGPGNLGTNITIFDNRSTANSWEGTNEDNETEPGTVHTQVWDLEGMFLNSGTKQLGIIGGFNFGTGVSVSGNPNSPFTTGDIFVDVNGDAKYGTGTVASDGYKYDYVIHISSIGASSGIYSVYSVLATGTLNQPTDISTSTPWTYTPASGQNAITGFSGKTFNVGDVGTDNSAFYNFKDDAGNVTNTAGVHYYMSGFDLSFLTSTQLSTALFHYTIECGNDNLIGKTPSVPEGGATILTLGAAMAALAGARRRFGRKV